MNTSSNPENDSLARAEALLLHLNEHRLIGYGAALPGPLDEAYRELAGIYLQADGVLREHIRAAVDDGTRLLLLGFCGRFATLAARHDDAAALKHALVAHALEDFRHDPRENIMRMALVHHVAALVKLKPAALFGEVGALASEQAAAQLKAFIDRPKASKSLKAMRLRQVEGPDGIAFENW